MEIRELDKGLNTELINFTLQEILQRNISSEKQGGITFINGKDKTEYLSYKKLFLEATYMLYDLQQLGLKPGDELVFQFQSIRNFVVTFWACVFGKIIPIPITFGTSIGVLTKICNAWEKLNNPRLISDLDSYGDILFSYYKETGNEALKTLSSNFIAFQTPSFSEQVLPLPSDKSDIVFVQFSSGSTGTPKGVINTQENILYNLTNSKFHLNIGDSDKFLGWMPLTHDMGLVFFHLLPLVANVKQYLMTPVTFLAYPELWIESIAENEITISGSPNFGYKYSLDRISKANLEGKCFDKLRIMINSAEPVSISVCKAFTKALAPYGFSSDVIKPGYGLAEAVLGVSLCIGYSPQLLEHYVNRSRLTVGLEIEFLEADDRNSAPFADLGVYFGTEIKITDRAGRAIDDGRLGFINIKSNAVTSGYYNEPELTKKILSQEGWLYTGDLGFIFNNHLVITGREKEMIVIKGQNYFPNDLDKLMEEIPEIDFQQVASCSVFNEQSHQDVIFFFVKHNGTIEEFHKLSLKMKKHLKLTVGLGINKIIRVDNIPKTTSGKVQRYVLRDDYLKGKFNDFLVEFNEILEREKSKIRLLSKLDIERKILNTMSQILNLDDLHNHVNFFDLGITSLQIMQLKGHIESFIHEDIDEVIFFQHTTADALSEYLFSDVLQNSQKSLSLEKEIDLSSAKSRMKKLLKR